MSFFVEQEKKLTYTQLLYMKKEEKDEIRTKFLKNKTSKFNLEELTFLTLINTPSLEIPNIGRYFSTENIFNEIAKYSNFPYVSGTLILEELNYNTERPDYITSFSELKPGDILIITTKDTKLEIDIFEDKENFAFKPYFPLSFVYKKIQVYNKISKIFSKFTINCTWIMDKFEREKLYDRVHDIIINNKFYARLY